MRMWIFAGAVVTLAGFLVEPAPAQETIQKPGTVITTAQPSTQPARGGLLQRIRDRRQGVTTVSEPVTQTTTTTKSSQPQTTVQQAQATRTVTSSEMPVMETRQGLLGRLRARRGR